MKLIEKVVARETLQSAYDWCCKARKDFPAHSDIWLLRERWDKIRPILQQQLLSGTYRFAPMEGYVTRDGNSDHFFNRVEYHNGIPLTITEGIPLRSPFFITRFVID